ncbi:putative selection and upkeep of intraepithelial T-cells protein 1 homolog [Myotis myotis]|uniref:putative selection and upkeep of intraepithelial T-cells protein 1 homolog n=1 Tax=Myotis myotis TaxID=51298 RepID=UPI001748A393|nr:putative selection and upkeep of intraepithelial T-cells protein 1 homolog [Myotis myotis]
MEFTAHTFFGCFSIIFFLVIQTAISELFTVDSPVGPMVALLGEEVKLHCYISPAQNAEHMEIYWYHKSFTKPLQLYKRGNDPYRETSLDNIKRTEILKEDIGKGNITLRIQNVSVSDGGKYRCLFKDGNFSKEAVQELKVLAPDLDLEIQVKINRLHGIQIKCSSGGWFPQPQMQWVNSRGELIPLSSKSETQDEAGLFHMHITLFLEKSQGMITCWLQHPVTGQEKRTSIQMADILIQQHHFQKEVTYTSIISLSVVYGVSVILFLIAYWNYKYRGISILKGSLFSMTKVCMMRILPEIFTSMFTISILILSPHIWLRKLFLNR